MMKKKYIVLSLCLFIILSGFLSVFFSYLYRYKGKKITDEWDETSAFDTKYVVTIEKEKNKDFVILNLADIQLCDIEDFFKRKKIHDEIHYLIQETKPDLITLTGDQTWSNENLMSLKCIIRWLDKEKIPYAPVFGNHDYGNDFNSAVASREKCSDLYEKGKYCLYKRGPTNLGNTLGNYVINITEDGEIIRTLYMLDSGNDTVIRTEQINFVKWHAEGIKKLNHDEYVTGMVFTHEPIPEYRDAYLDYFHGENNNIGPVYAYCSLYGVNDSGFFDVMKEINIKDYVCGHQHTNNFTLVYEGVRLTFACKTGELSFYYDDGNVNLNGGTLFTINKDETVISNFYVKSGQFHFKNSDNIYEED